MILPKPSPYISGKSVEKGEIECSEESEGAWAMSNGRGTRRLLID